MSKRNNLAQLFLFKIGLSRLISKLSLISRPNLLFPFVKIVNSSKDGMLLQFKRWLRIAFFFDGLVFLNLKGDIPICSLDPWKYSVRRNVNSDFSNQSCNYFFWIGSCKKLHAKILMARHFIITFLFKSCSWLQQFQR